MIINKRSLYIIILIGLISMIGCREEPLPEEGFDLTNISYDPQPYDLFIPEHLPTFETPADNPLTEDGVRLGQHLFFDPILSVDSTLACSGCHDPKLAFTDGGAFSVGVDGKIGTRSSMSLLNVAYTFNGLFWDGSSLTLEHQALLPVENPVEQQEDWFNVERKLQNNESYRSLFRKAFGIQHSSEITKELAAMALAQYQRILISADSKFDRVEYGNTAAYTNDELEGRDMYFDADPLLPDAECAHCHNGPLITTQQYFNNGIEPNIENLTDFPDQGRGKVTNILFDNGKFRAPTLRNIALTAPYMHDGRFATLEEVMDHYNSGGHYSENIDPLIAPLGLSDSQKQNVIKFLHTMTDTSYLSNPFVQNPFQ